MPIMSVAEWKSDAVKMTLFKDSGDFKSITSALEAYHNPATLGTAQSKLTALSDALDQWKDGKSNWQTTARNKRGAIQTLETQIGQMRLGAAGPAPLLGAYAAPNQLALVIAKANARQVAVDSDTLSVSTSVTQDQDDGAGGLLHFQWDVYMRLTQRKYALEVKVPILMVGGDSSVKSNWKTQVESAWSGTNFKIPGAPQPKILAIQFVLEWASAGTPDVFTVNVHNPVGIAPKKEYVKTMVGGKSEWKKQSNDSRAHDGGTMGTPNMDNWGADDKSAISHEFGHMIGNPDEYITKRFNGANLNGAIYNQPPFSTNSIMNNTNPEGRIKARHFDFIKAQYGAWKGIPPNTIEVIVGK